MGQIKKFGTDWLEQAWRISNVIADLPDGPPMSPLTGVGKAPPLTDWRQNFIELLQDHIEVFLQYRSRIVYKITDIHPDGTKNDIAPDSRNPADTQKILAKLQAKVGELKGVDLWAYDAHMKLGRILIDRYVCPEWKRQLPLIVACISGETTSQTATLKAMQHRVRRNELRKAKLEIKRLNPDYSNAQVLNSLEGDGVIQSWDAVSIRWTDSEDNDKTTVTGTFHNWKAKP